MPLRLPFRVKQTSQTAGTGTITLQAVDVTRYRSFAQHYGSGSTLVAYVLQGPSGSPFFEIGVGTFNGTNQLSRDASQVIASSNNNALVNIPSAITYDVFAVDQDGMISQIFTSAETLTANDSNALMRWQGTTTAALTFPLTTKTPEGWQVGVRNESTVNVNLVGTGSETINGVTNLALLPGESGIFFRVPGGYVGTLQTRQSRIVLDGAILASSTWTVSSAAPSGGANGDVWFQT